MLRIFVPQFRTSLIEQYLDLNSINMRIERQHVSSSNSNWHLKNKMRFAFVFAFIITESLAFDLPLLNPTFNDLDDPRLSYVPVEDGTLTRGTIKGMNEPFSPETDVQFELYTQRNTNEAQIISPLNLTSIEASNFNASNPTRYFIHGWRSSGKWTKRFVNAYLDLGKHNVNFIAVNWSKSSSTIDYPTACRSIFLMGPYIARLINTLVEKFNVKLSDVHIVGHSLGAHIAGIAGKNIAGGKVGKITGLDTAYPLFAYSSIASRLHHDDAEYVESIHSNAGRWGFKKPIGQASFYPNGGHVQPGCGIDPYSKCSHSRAIEFFLESLYSSVEFYGFGCESLETIVAGGCKIVINNGAIMGGEPGNFGKVRGLFYLRTNTKHPFALGRPPIPN